MVTHLGLDVRGHHIVAPFELGPQVGHLASQALHLGVQPPVILVGVVPLRERTLLLRPDLGAQTSVLTFDDAHLLPQRLDTLDGLTLLTARCCKR